MPARDGKPDAKPPPVPAAQSVRPSGNSVLKTMALRTSYARNVVVMNPLFHDKVVCRYGPKASAPGWLLSTGTRQQHHPASVNKTEKERHTCAETLMGGSYGAPNVHVNVGQSDAASSSRRVQVAAIAIRVRGTAGLEPSVTIK